MIIYLPDDPLSGEKYGFSYQSLRDDYVRFRLMSNDEFIENVLDILHFACVVCYIKEMQTQSVLADTGIIHELVHLLKDKETLSLRSDADPCDLIHLHDPQSLEKVRQLFNEKCCLA